MVVVDTGDKDLEVVMADRKCPCPAVMGKFCLHLGIFLVKDLIYYVMLNLT